MKGFHFGMALVFVACGLTTQLVAQEESARQEDSKKETPGAVGTDARAYMQFLVDNLSSRSGQIRFSVREALVVLGHQAVPLLKEAQRSTRNPHVRAFVDRILGRIKAASKRVQGTGRSHRLFRNRGRDMDRLAMDLDLSLEQLAKLAPIFERYDKGVKDLTAAMAEGRAHLEPGAWSDFEKERRLLAEEAEPKIDELLGQEKGKRAMGYLQSLGGLPIMVGKGKDAVQIVMGRNGRITKLSRVRNDN